MESNGDNCFNDSDGCSRYCSLFYMGFNNRIDEMKRIKLPRDVWISLYGRLNNSIEGQISMSHVPSRRGNEIKKDNIRDEVLNIMNFYFDRDFQTGITDNTEITIHEYNSTLAKLKGKGD